MKFWNIAEETKKEKERQQEEELMRKMDERRSRYMGGLQGLNNNY